MLRYTDLRRQAAEQLAEEPVGPAIEAMRPARIVRAHAPRVQAKPEAEAEAPPTPDGFLINLEI